MSDDDKKDDIAALRAEIEKLKSAVAGKEDKPPPKKEFVPEHREPIDWTARMSMPQSAIEAMVAAEPKDFMANVVHDNRAPTHPGMIPRSEQTVAGPKSGGDGTGWSAPTPLRPPDGVAQADRLMDAADKADRIELAQKIAVQEAAMRAALGKK
jgi:hypothetical protein